MAFSRMDFAREEVLNPIDALEDMLSGESDWSIARPSESELVIACPGQWATYQLHCFWQGEVQALHTTCMLEMRAPARLNQEINTLLAEMNSRLWVGHFELSREESSLMFRHTLLLRGIGGVSHEQVEDLVDVAVGECDRFYPAFQFVIWGGRNPQDALAASLLETQGEA